MRSMCEGQKLMVADLAKKIDALILLKEESNIESTVRDCNEKTGFAPYGCHRLNDFFFIWIGSLKPEALEYIDVWCEAVDGAGSVRIYYDSQFLLFNLYIQKFRLLYKVTDATSIGRIVELQGHFKREIDGFVDGGCSFDEAFILATKKISAAESLALELALSQEREHLFRLSEKYDIVDVRDNMDVFFDGFFYGIYYLELTLRANAAAAADILRLLLLYKHGGVFVDVDTLPSLRSVYGPISDGVSCNVQNIVRSEYFLRRRRALRGVVADGRAAVSVYEKYLEERNIQVLQHINTCAAQWSGTALSCPEVNVRENLISMAALETLHEYNNNVLAAIKRSKLVMIVLREIKRRYRFIFRHGFELGSIGSVPREHDLHRLSNYRFDAMSLEDNVTLFLTGPILILEVVLGVAYEVLSLDKSISPLALSYALRLDCVAFACREHTCYTPEHMRSSWM